MLLFSFICSLHIYFFPFHSPSCQSFFFKFSCYFQVFYLSVFFFFYLLITCIIHFFRFLLLVVNSSLSLFFVLFCFKVFMLFSSISSRCLLLLLFLSVQRTFLRLILFPAVLRIPVVNPSLLSCILKCSCYFQVFSSRFLFLFLFLSVQHSYFLVWFS